MDDVNGIIERAEERQKRLEKMIEKMMDKSEAILNAGKTNEEWLRTASTKELAEWFANNGFLVCGLFKCDDCKYYDKTSDDCIDYDTINQKQMWFEWLKEKHI